VIPFENASPTPGLEWVGESFCEAFHDQLSSPLLYVASREERLRAYDRQGVPTGIHASRATLYRIAEQMDVDYAVLGSYRYDGARLNAKLQLLDMRAPKLSLEVVESAPLTDLGNLQAAMAWDLLHLIHSDFSLIKDRYVANSPALRLDAQEAYVRGILAATGEEKIQHFREATRLNPEYSVAWLALGKAYYEQRSYEPAIAALDQVRVHQARDTSAHSLISGATEREANFYLGLAAYARGDFARSESAFEFVAAQVPLAEVFNNLGVVAARRGQKKAVEYFHRAIQNDESDADYQFNLGVSLAENGDRAGAARELRAAVEKRPNDGEAKNLLDSLAPQAGSIVSASTSLKIPQERIQRNYQEDAFRQMTTQMGGWAEQQFARVDPSTHARFHVELGKELMAHGFYAEAESEFRHAAAVDPASAAPLTALAENYEAQGDGAGARAQAEAALRVHESVEAYLVLARTDLRENKVDAAEASIKRALQMEPGNAAGQDLKRTLASMTAEKRQ
jgi:tetratricopeptide (TPR) repeat protein